MSEAAEAPQVDEKTQEAISAKILGAQDGLVPVYDPEANALKAVPLNRAAHFQEMGYKVGSEAQAAIIDHSPAAKLGAFLTAGGQAGSAGLLNIGLHATGHDRELKMAARAQADNEGYATAGTIAGVAGSALAGPLRIGGLGKGVLAAAAERGGIANVLAKGANVALQGAPAMAVQGASDALTQGAILDHPVTAEQMAASAFTDVAWNAGFNALTHGVVHAPGVLRSGVGNLIERAERWGVLKKEMVEDLNAVKGERVRASSQVYEREYAKGGPKPAPDTLGPEKQLGFDAGPDGAFVPEAPSAEMGIDYGEPEGQRGPRPEAGSKEATAATGEALGRMDTDMQPGVGLPDEVAAQMAEPLPTKESLFGGSETPVGSARAKFKIEPELEEVPQVESLSTKRAKLKAGEEAAKAERLRAIEPEDVDLGFEYEKGYTKRDKLHLIREWIKDGAAEAHPDAAQIWDIVQNLENEYQAVKTTKGYPNKAAVLTAKSAEKAAWKKELEEMFPARVDHETGEYIPGFKELNEEYGRIANDGRSLKDLKRPEYIDRNQRQFEIAQATHAEAVKKAEKAQANVDMLDNHAAEIDRQAAVIERNKVSKADAAARTKALNAEADLAEKKLSKEAADKARKAIRDAEAAERARVRAEAKAEREAASAKTRAERKDAADAARKATAEAKAHKARVDAHAKARATHPNGEPIPKSGRAGPKSVKNEAYTVDTEGPNGKERREYSRKDNGQTVRERVKVSVKSPKVPPKMKFKRYSPIFSGDLITKLTAGGYMTGTSHITTPIAGGMTAVNFAVSLASHHDAIGKAFIRLTNGINRVAVPALAVGARVARANAKRDEYSPRTHDVQDYPHVAKTINYLSANPSAVVSSVQQRYPQLAAEKPQLVQNISMTLIRAIQALQDQIPKKPYDPTLKDQEFLPTRAQQIKTLRAWTLLANPHLGVDYADPDNMRLLQMAYPELTKHYQDHLTSVIQDGSVPMHGPLSRQVSSFLGANVRPMDDAAALKRTQQTAGPEPMQKPQGGGIGSAAPSSKITTQATQRDMPVDGLYQLGA